MPRIVWKRAAIIATAVILIYVLLAYVVIPAAWIRYAHRHPLFDQIPRIPYTHDDHPGDPLNVALIGTETELKKIMLAAKWYPADPLSLKS